MDRLLQLLLKTVVPMIQDYIMREEKRLQAAEGKRRLPLRLAGE